MKMTMNQTCGQRGCVALMVLLIGLLPFWVTGQTYLINVDFNGTTGNTPPAGWGNTTGIEDHFYPKGIGIELLGMGLHSCWRQDIFNTDNTGQEWDSNVNGYPDSQGVCVWALLYRNPKLGPVHDVSGGVTLRRLMKKQRLLTPIGS
jgi:hypothetical protein